MSLVVFIFYLCLPSTLLNSAFQMFLRLFYNGTVNCISNIGIILFTLLGYAWGTQVDLIVFTIVTARITVMRDVTTRVFVNTVSPNLDF
jgi:hypothetical protein